MQPSQVRHAYGFDQVSFNGAGQTIAIVDAYNDPTIAKDLATFDAQYGIATPPSLTVMSQSGSTSSLPASDASGGWELEESIDVEWAHANVPGAKLILVEASSSSTSNLLAAVDTASARAHVVSMSWGGSEFGVSRQQHLARLKVRPRREAADRGRLGSGGVPGSSPGIWQHRRRHRQDDLLARDRPCDRGGGAEGVCRARLARLARLARPQSKRD